MGDTSDTSQFVTALIVPHGIYNEYSKLILISTLNRGNLRRSDNRDCHGAIRLPLAQSQKVLGRQNYVIRTRSELDAV